MYVSPKHTQKQPMMKSEKNNVFQHVICVVIEKHKFSHTYIKKLASKSKETKIKHSKRYKMKHLLKVFLVQLYPNCMLRFGYVLYVSP